LCVGIDIEQNLVDKANSIVNRLPKEMIQYRNEGSTNDGVQLEIPRI
jgi:hypothetical protein